MSESRTPALGSILVVDDEEPVARLLQQWLADEGYDVRYALGFPQARALLESEPFDLVTLDIMMPEINGLEGLQWMAAHHPDTAAVMLTAIDTVSIVVEAMRAGAVGYLIKPLNLELISQDIARVMDRQRLLAENRAHQRELERQVEAQTHQLRVASMRLEERERELRARDELVRLQISAAAEPHRLYEQVGDIVARCLRVSEVVMYRPDSKRRELVPVGVFARTRMDSVRPDRVPVGAPATTRPDRAGLNHASAGAPGAGCADQGSNGVEPPSLPSIPVRSPDSLVAQVFASGEPAATETGEIAAPILYSAEPLGVLWAGERTSPGHNDAATLAGLGREVALLIRTVELIWDLEREEGELVGALATAAEADAGVP